MSEKCGACGSEYGHCDNCAWLKEEIERPTTGETIARLERERSAALAEVERLQAELARCCEQGPWPSCDCRGCSTMRALLAAEIDPFG